MYFCVCIKKFNYWSLKNLAYYNSFSMEFEAIKIASTVTLSMVINIEDFDHKVELWKGAVDGPYIYVEDLV